VSRFAAISDTVPELRDAFRQELEAAFDEQRAEFDAALADDAVALALHHAELAVVAGRMAAKFAFHASVHVMREHVAKELAAKDEVIAGLERRLSRHAEHLGRLESRMKAQEQR
jgi:hypothetical protein